MDTRKAQCGLAPPVLPGYSLHGAGASSMPGIARFRRIGARPARARHDAAGSATIEFVFLAPFILLTMALVWDLREYVSYHTEIAREMYVAAELIANETDMHPVTGDGPVDEVMRRAMEKLAPVGAGTIAVAVITRGTVPVGASTTCNLPGDTCLPMVQTAWPPVADPDRGTWLDIDSTMAPGGDCATFPPLLPSPGGHFAAELPVLPNEVPPNATPPPAQEDWLSRNMRLQEWWVVVDSCLHPDGGLFGGFVLKGLQFFDISGSAFVLRKRAAWGSVHDLSTCNWC